MSDFDVSLTPAAAINVTVSGGVGPAGAAGAGGVATLQGLTGALTLAAVGGTWTVAGSTITLTVSSASVAWADITGKPDTFAPSAHTHVVADVTGLQAALDGKQAAGSYAAASHTHTAGQVTGLATVATSGAYADLSGAPAAYSLPTATASVLGGVKIGSGLSIDGSGVVTAAGTYTLPAATVSTLGGVIVGTGLAVSSGTISVSYGTSSSTACVGDDARLSDARTPTAHASTHQTGGADAVASVVVTPTSLTADQNDWAIGTGDVFRVAGTAARAITGIAAGTSGLAILLINVGSFALTLRHQSASSTAANRITVPWAGDCVIAANGGAVVMVYDSTSSTWRVV